MSEPNGRPADVRAEQPAGGRRGNDKRFVGVDTLNRIALVLLHKNFFLEFYNLFRKPMRYL